MEQRRKFNSDFFSFDPVFSYHISNLNYRKLVLAGKLELIKRYQIYQYEKASRRARENALKHRRGTNDWIILGDMNGYNKREHFCLSCKFGLDYGLESNRFK
jgi:hypothetical protein